MLNKLEIAIVLEQIAFLLRGQPVLPPGETVLTASETPAPAPKRKGRPPGSTNAAPPVTETPAEPATPEPPSKLEGSKTLDELRSLIKPLILATRGEEVKAVLNKFAPKDHSGDYTLSLLSERHDTHADFVKEIEALLI